MRISARDGAGKRVSARERYVGKCKTCLTWCFPNCNWNGDRRLGHSARRCQKRNGEVELGV